MHLTEEGRRVGYETAFEIPLPASRRLAKPVHDLIMLGSLPPRVRELYGLEWGTARELAFRSAVADRARLAPGDPRAYCDAAAARATTSSSAHREPADRERRAADPGRHGLARAGHRPAPAAVTAQRAGHLPSSSGRHPQRAAPAVSAASAGP